MNSRTCTFGISVGLRRESYACAARGGRALGR